MFRSTDENRACHGDLRPDHLDVQMPQFRTMGWGLMLLKATWLPLTLAVVGRWFSSVLHILISSLIAFVIVQLGESQQVGLALPQRIVTWLQRAESPVSAGIALALTITAGMGIVEFLVDWTRVWVHLIINRHLTPQIVNATIRVSKDTHLDASTAVQRWLLKTDIVYFLHESVAASIGHAGTVVIALVATYHANRMAGNVAVAFLFIWIATLIPLTIQSLRATRESALAHESLGRVIRDSVALRADLSRPSLNVFWAQRNAPNVDKLQKKIAKEGLWSVLLEGVLALVAQVMPLAAVLASLGAGGLGTTVAILLYLTRMSGPLRSLAGIFPWLQLNLISLERVFHLVGCLHGPLAEVPRSQAARQGLSIRNWRVHPGSDTRISFPDLTASHESVLCLVGPSGSGKSTLLKALAAQMKTESGELLMDGQPVDCDSAAWRETCTLVPQEPQLVPGTINDNWHGFPGWRPTLCRLAAIQRLLSSTSGGAERFVGIDDVGVSVGQRRAIAVLRAVGAGSPVLLLDEPIAGVDDSIVTAIRDVLEEARKEGRIVILTAHEHDLARIALPATTVVRLR